MTIESGSRHRSAACPRVVLTHSQTSKDFRAKPLLVSQQFCVNLMREIDAGQKYLSESFDKESSLTNNIVKTSVTRRQKNSPIFPKKKQQQLLFKNVQYLAYCWLGQVLLDGPMAESKHTMLKSHQQCDHMARLFTHLQHWKFAQKHNKFAQVGRTFAKTIYEMARDHFGKAAKFCLTLSHWPTTFLPGSIKPSCQRNTGN